MAEIKECKNPASLFTYGAIIKVQICINSVLSEIYTANGTPLPDPITLNALIDTGSIFTIIKTGAIDKLSLNPNGYQLVMGVNDSKGTKQPTYNVGLSFYGIDYFDVRAIVQPLYFPGISCLIGRDILHNCLFVYNGKTGEYILKF